MTHLLLALLILVASTASAITIEGPTRVDLGKEIVLDVTGTPQPDDDVTWGQAFVWLRDLTTDMNAPEGSEAVLKAGFILDVNLETGSVFPKLQLRASPTEPGDYIVMVVYWPDRARAHHRFTVGPATPPPPPPPPPLDFEARLKPPADPATAKLLLDNLTTSPWFAAPTVIETLAGGKSGWDNFIKVSQEIKNETDLATVIRVLQGVK